MTAEITTTLQAIFDSPVHEGETYPQWRDRVLKDIRRALADRVQSSCCHAPDDNMVCLSCWAAAVIVRGSAE